MRINYYLFQYKKKSYDATIPKKFWFIYIPELEIIGKLIKDFGLVDLKLMRRKAIDMSIRICN